MKALFFCDVLGVRAIWKHAGAAGVAKICDRFHGLLYTQLRLSELGAHVRQGLVESDSIALEFDDVESALRFATVLFQKTFIALDPSRSTQHHLWIRGVIVPGDEDTPLRSQRVLAEFAPTVIKYSYSKPLLAALTAEKSGYRGMRLLVESTLANAFHDSDGWVGLEKRLFLRKLKYSEYPAEGGADFQDALWMLADMPFNPTPLVQKMNLRLRIAAKDPEELAQAASTQVVFHEAHAILDDYETRAQQPGGAYFLPAAVKKSAHP